MCRRLVLCLAVLVPAHELVSVSAQTPAAQTQQRSGTQLWYEAYDNGVRAIQARNWQAAIDALQAALKLRPQQARLVAFSGSRVGAYIPDYFLGVAFLNLKRFAEADAAFDRVRQASLVVEGDARYRELQTQAASAKFEASLARADQFIKDGNAARAGQELATARNFGSNDTRLTTVQARIDELTKPVPTIPTEELVVVPNLLGSLEQSARAQLATLGLGLGAVQTREGDARENSILDQVPNAGTRVRKGSSVNLVVATPKRNVENGPPPVNPAPPVNPPAGGGPSTGGARPPPVLPPASTVNERMAIAAFFSGRYAEAARDLTALIAASEAPRANAPGKAPLPTPRARFYLACSLAALVITGDRDKSEMTSAKQQLARAGAMSQFSSDIRYVSPRILTMLGVRQ